MLHVRLLGLKLVCSPCVRQLWGLSVVLYLLRYSGWNIISPICRLFFVSVSSQDAQFGRLGMRYQSPPVPNQMCSAKEESDILFLLWFVLKLIGKATRQHWTEWLGRENRERWRRFKGRKTNNNTGITLTVACTETAAESMLVSGEAVRKQHPKLGAYKKNKHRKCRQQEELDVKKRNWSRDESVVVLRDGWLYDNTFIKYLWPPA